MAAAILNLEDFPQQPERKRFAIPLQSTVAAYMQQKKGWPIKFCHHYAERFWNHYQAQGWRLSNNVPMKDWRAAFNSQWQSPKYEEDRILLQKCIDEHRKNSEKETPEMYLNQCLALHAKGAYKPARGEVLQIYTYLKETGRISLTREDLDSILERGKGSQDMCRMLAVRTLFDKMVAYSLKF
jgi:hypothetical protein